MVCSVGVMGFLKFGNGLLEFGRDGSRARLARRGGGEIPWRTDAQLELCRIRKRLPLGPGAERTGQMTGNHRHIVSREQSTDARLEGSESAVGRARAFGKENEDIARVGEQGVTQREALPNMSLASKGQGVDQD